MKALRAKSEELKAKSTPIAEYANGHPPAHAQVSTSASEIPKPNAFLEEAKREPQRKLITDHIQTINVLRNEKRFTFRAIAEWLTERGFETDHSSVYRAYLAAIPEENRHPDEDWEEIDIPE